MKSITCNTTVPRKNLIRDEKAEILCRPAGRENAAEHFLRSIVLGKESNCSHLRQADHVVQTQRVYPTVVDLASFIFNEFREWLGGSNGLSSRFCSCEILAAQQISTPSISGSADSKGFLDDGPGRPPGPEPDSNPC